MSIPNEKNAYIGPRQCLINNASQPAMGIGMMTSSNGNIFRVTGHLCGEFTGPWWFETPPWSLWRQRNGVSPGVRMQPVVADLQEGHGDPNQARGPEGFSLLPSANPHQTQTIPTLQCRAQESGDLQYLQFMKYWFLIHVFQWNYNARPRIYFLSQV